uniref:Uncharacterized protein n=1 Tax=Rhizophora mucronata TaxID=61149 RepID=A0A2P2P022_RHIMU
MSCCLLSSIISLNLSGAHLLLGYVLIIPELRDASHAFVSGNFTAKGSLTTVILMTSLPCFASYVLKPHDSLVYLLHNFRSPEKFVRQNFLLYKTKTTTKP